MRLKRQLNPMLLWLRHRPVAAAPIQPLVWELPCVAGAAIKKNIQIDTLFLMSCQVNSSSQSALAELPKHMSTL